MPSIVINNQLKVMNLSRLGRKCGGQMLPWGISSLAASFFLFSAGLRNQLVPGVSIGTRQAPSLKGSITEHRAECPMLYSSLPLVFVLHVVLYISQCYSPNSSLPLFPCRVHFLFDVNYFFSL